MGWSYKPTDFGRQIRIEQRERLEKAADFLIERLILDSPILSGRFQDSWESNGSYPLISLSNDARSDGGFPYPLLLEDGYSDQAPHGVVRQNVSTLKTLMDNGVL